MTPIPCGGCQREGCRLCWLAANDNRYRKLFGLPEDPDLKKPKRHPRKSKQPLVILREVRCVHLATRLEFKHGCGGMKCRHECDLGLPAVPGVYCQTCEAGPNGYEADAGPWV